MLFLVTALLAEGLKNKKYAKLWLKWVISPVTSSNTVVYLDSKTAL
jgi:hypothetical protein